MMSVVPPGAKGTTKRIGYARGQGGEDCARATAGAARPSRCGSAPPSRRPKTEMLVGAFQHLLQSWEEARAAAFGGKDLQDVPFDVYLRFLWREIFRKPSYVAALELMLAARVDTELGERLREVLDSWARDRSVRWQQLLRFSEVRKGGVPVHDPLPPPRHGDPYELQQKRRDQ